MLQMSAFYKSFKNNFDAVIDLSRNNYSSKITDIIENSRISLSNINQKHKLKIAQNKNLKLTDISNEENIFESLEKFS